MRGVLFTIPFFILINLVYLQVSKAEGEHKPPTNHVHRIDPTESLDLVTSEEVDGDDSGPDASGLTAHLDFDENSIIKEHEGYQFQKVENMVAFTRMAKIKEEFDQVNSSEYLDKTGLSLMRTAMYEISWYFKQIKAMDKAGKVYETDHKNGSNFSNDVERVSKKMRTIHQNNANSEDEDA